MYTANEDNAVITLVATKTPLPLTAWVMKLVFDTSENDILSPDSDNKHISDFLNRFVLQYVLHQTKNSYSKSFDSISKIFFGFGK